MYGIINCMKKDKVFVDSKNILNWIPENPYGDASGTKATIDLMKQLLDEHGPMPILVDLSKADKPDKDQRQIIISSIQNNFHNISRIALFGETPILKVISFFIINTANYKNMKFFSSRSIAEKWLLDT